jgi:rod shape determining protein RodA
MSLRAGLGRQTELTLAQKLREVNWGLVLLVTAVASIGFAMLYSAAGGAFDPWASRQMARFGVGLVLMLAAATVDFRLWLRWAYPAYGVGLALLVAVETVGAVGMGAQRWIQLGPIQLQPSEVMKIALVLALARWFHYTPAEAMGKLRTVLPPILLIAAPVLLVLKQPDLGTAMLMLMSSAAVLFVAGVRLWKFALAGLVALGSLPVAWSMLRDYQKQRVLTFLDPETDPLGAGYHITQSKIALGSGGVFGKGYMQGTQAHLSFLPEHQTDFIFTMLAEEFGLVGCLALLALYVMILVYCFGVAIRCRHQFGRLVAMGIASTFFLYVFINMAMVMGLVPVVGVPLPLVSYGGTAMMTLLIGFGLLIGAWVHRDAAIGRRPGLDGE